MTSASSCVSSDPAPAAATAQDAGGSKPPQQPAPLLPARTLLRERVEAWARLQRQLSATLRSESPDAAWLQVFDSLCDTLRKEAAQDPDLAMFVLIQPAAQETQGYSARHAMACAVIGELAARLQGWPESEISVFVRAALSMNLSMTCLQDRMATQSEAPSGDQRAAIDDHAGASARLLRQAGVDDPLWLGAVEQHHRVPAAAGFEADVAVQPTATRLAELLRRIDIYTAKLSRRAHRSASTPALAARDACLGPAGHPDSIGATLLRVLGLYPPGTFVAMANGEVGVVIERGSQAHTPRVAALRRADGGLILPPVCRDTQRRPYAVLRGLCDRDVHVRLDAARVLWCRGGPARDHG